MEGQCPGASCGAVTAPTRPLRCAPSPWDIGLLQRNIQVPRSRRCSHDARCARAHASQHPDFSWRVLPTAFLLRCANRRVYSLGHTAVFLRGEPASRRTPPTGCASRPEGPDPHRPCANWERRACFLRRGRSFRAATDPDPGCDLPHPASSCPDGAWTFVLENHS